MHFNYFYKNSIVYIKKSLFYCFYFIEVSNSLRQSAQISLCQRSMFYIYESQALYVKFFVKLKNDLLKTRSNAWFMNLKRIILACF